MTTGFPVLTAAWVIVNSTATILSTMTLFFDMPPAVT